MSNKYNQFVRQLMRENKPDEEKLVGIGAMIRNKYQLVVHREPILLFDKNDGHLVKSAFAITEQEYKNHIIHVPDILFYVRNEMWVFEVDGWIHNVKDKVAVKDEWREQHYKKAKLNYKIFNELDILLKQGKKPDRAAMASEVFKEMEVVIDKIVKEQGL